MLKIKKIPSILLSSALTVSLSLTAFPEVSNVLAATTTPTAAPTVTPTSSSSTNFNYGEALQKSLMFYELQRSGKLPADKRDNWRGDSALSDGSDNGLDLTGGWYDAGDNCKFNLPMAYSSAMLGWSVYENRDAYVKSGQLKYVLGDIKWVTDYLIKCHPSPNVYYYQVGDGGLDHKWWGASEVMQMARPSYKVDLDNPGSTVTAEAAAELAVASIIFKSTDPTYSATCLTHAKQLYSFADTTKSDKGYTAANGYYNSWSGFYDELSWAGAWLYLATNDNTYIDKAESYVPNWPTLPQTTTIGYKWAQCWDDVHYGAQLLLARITNKAIYKESVEKSLDYWTTGYNGEKIKYTPKGLAWMDSWGSIRYATTMGYLADVYAGWSGCTQTKVKTYKDFAKSQLDYALGSSGRSFVVGFGVNPPENEHHRTAQGSWSDQMIVPDYHRHVLYGALVGGPDSSDGYEDVVSNFTENEVACDYNAGFTGLLAREYAAYGGTPITNLNAVEKITNDELYVEAGVNASGPNFCEIKAVLNNKTGWPARVTDKLSFKYFIDISEFVSKGYSAKDITVKTGYTTGGTASQLIPYNAAKNIYYVNVDFTGTKIYPGGQSDYKKEVQFRMSGPENVNIWDNSNDFSYQGITTTPGDTPVETKNISVYDAGVKVFGNEPADKPAFAGDINGDGKINILDYLKLKQYLSSSKVSINVKNSDMNGDGKVDTSDYTLLRKYLLDPKSSRINNL